MKVLHDPLKAAIELREQLASETRRLLFFLGAGTSMAAGLPGILALTKQVSERLIEPQKSGFARLCGEIPNDPNVEMVLDRIRTLRDLIGENKNKEYDGFNRDDAQKLDAAICQAISACPQARTQRVGVPSNIRTVA